MGRICPILNHPLKDNDGVLIDDEALVNFIQKRNLDFLPNELVCRYCKCEITKLYNKKRRKAIELYKSRMHDNSVSSLKTSKTSSSSASSEHSLPHNGHIQRVEIHGLDNNRNISISLNQRNGNQRNSIMPANSNISVPSDNIVVSETSMVLSTSISNVHSVLQENNQAANKAVSAIHGIQPKVTIRKKTIRDYLNVKAPMETPVIASINPPVSATRNSEKTNLTGIQNNPNVSDAGYQDVIRRLSQEPTTSNVANTNKRRLLAIVDSDDDDERLNLNALGDTRAPHIQPIPPKRKTQPDYRNSLAQDIMDQYIKQINGG